MYAFFHRKKKTDSKININNLQSQFTNNNEKISRKKGTDTKAQNKLLKINPTKYTLQKNIPGPVLL